MTPNNERRRIAPRDTWPDLRLTIRPLPWSWRLRPHFYSDDVDGPAGHCSVEWLFLTVEWYAESKVRDWFTEDPRRVKPFGHGPVNFWIPEDDDSRPASGSSLHPGDLQT